MLKPTLKVNAVIDDKVRVEFNKQGQNAVRIQLKRGGGNFETVGDPTTSPFVDHTASTGGNPEKREYHAFYLEKNETRRTILGYFINRHDTLKIMNNGEW